MDRLILNQCLVTEYTELLKLLYQVVVVRSFVTSGTDTTEIIKYFGLISDAHEWLEHNSRQLLHNLMYV